MFFALFLGQHMETCFLGMDSCLIYTETEHTESSLDSQVNNPHHAAEMQTMPCAEKATRS